MLKRLGVPVHDADACVHQLFARGGAATNAIGRTFPGVVSEGEVDRKQLSKEVFGQPEQLKRLERIVHPLVRMDRDRFLASHRRLRSRLVVLDVPLLFETGGDNICDSVMVVSAPPFLQRRRALARQDMSTDKLDLILARQMPNSEKRRRADVVIATGHGFADTNRRIRRYIFGIRHGH
tara:strand:- start:49 stop:585 length:537 start_codon:yes stop_codon:yes gene_type:complete